MALAERFVRIRVQPGFERDFKSAGTKAGTEFGRALYAAAKPELSGAKFTRLGTEAGRDWGKAFVKSAKLELSRADLTVKVNADVSRLREQVGKAASKDQGVYDPRSQDGASRAFGSFLKYKEQRDKVTFSGPAASGSERPVKAAPIEVDPLLGAFQAEVRRQVSALSRQVAIKVPVEADTATVRAQLGASLKTLQDKAKVKIAVDSPDKAKYEADLRTMLAEVQSRVKATIPVEEPKVPPIKVPKPPKVPIELDPLTARFQADVRRELNGLTRTALKIPVTPETDGLRRQVSRQIAMIERTLKIKVPVGADGDRARGQLGGQLQALKGTLGGALGVSQAGLKTLSGGFDAVSGSAGRAASAAGSVGSSLSGLAGPIGTALGIGAVALAITALPAIALAASGAIFALGGALASLPAAGVGLGALTATVGLGFAGLAGHFKKTASGGGGAAKSMSAVNNATRSLARANRDLVKATKEVDKARADEIERIDDLGRALRGAVIDEADAVAAVAEARTALAEARATGDPNAVGAAERALSRANLTLDESRDKVGDLAADKAKADRDGVEGSDAVQQAYERQRDAVESVKAAEEALADARKSGGGGGGAAQELMKLAPAAQEVVDKIKLLKPVFEDIRLAVQQNLFKGVAPEIGRLADAWKTPLKGTLTSYATSINGVFRNLGASLREPTFIKNITASAENFRLNFDKIGKAVSGPLVDAFGRLARAAAPFIDMIGDKVSGLVNNFSDWIATADDSGKLDKFMKDAAYYLGVIWDIGGNVLGLFGDIFGIFFETKNQGGAKDYLSGLNDQLLLLREWLKDPENQKKIKEMIEKFGEFVKNGVELSKWIMEKGLPALSDLWKKIDEGKDKIEGVKKKFDEWKTKFEAVRDVITKPIQFGDIFGGFYSALKSALDRAINLFNSLNLGVSFSVAGQRYGTNITGTGRVIEPRGLGGALGSIKLASGGVARATPGGINATIAEGGKDEAVAPVDVLQDYVRTAVAEGNAAAAGGDTIIQLFMFPGAAEHDRFVISAAERNRGTFAKIVNSGNKRLGYAG